MKITTLFKYVTILSIAFSCSNSCLAADFNQKHSFEDFARAVAKVESNNNSKAIGDNGKARGILQIHEICFNDAAKYDAELLKYGYQGCFNPQVSKRVLWAYCAKYEKEALKNGDFEILAKLWNGGCGWRTKTGKVKSNLDTYWMKVFQNLK